VVAQLLLEALCCFILEFGIAGGTAALSSSNPLTTPSTKLSTPQQRQAKQATPCALDGCYALSFRTTDYCWKHQDEHQTEPEPDPEQEPNWWVEQTE